MSAVNNGDAQTLWNNAELTMIVQGQAKIIGELREQIGALTKRIELDEGYMIKLEKRIIELERAREEDDELPPMNVEPSTGNAKLDRVMRFTNMVANLRADAEVHGYDD